MFFTYPNNAKVLCPLEDRQFGKAKFGALVVEGGLRQEDWHLFTQLELHFQFELREQLDSASIDFRVNGRVFCLVFMFLGVFNGFVFRHNT